ncbi:MAG: hypothetical protein ABJA89_15500 [Lapillicoccus sp.]
MHQPGRLRGAGELRVVVEEALSERGRTEALQVHGEAGDVVENVEPPQPVVEVHGVEGPRAVAQAEDVVREQVAVAVAHQTGRHPGLEQRAAAGDELEREIGDPLDELRLGREGPQPVEVAAPPGLQRGG